ncbi:MAG: pyrimidine dimer DNA glycosylase, partial [Thermoproteus sp.]
MYFNDGVPYLEDLVGYFRAVVDEWRSRGFRNSVTLSDVEGLIGRVRGASGTPITHVHEVEYRRVLLLKDPCYYMGKFSREEILEVLETEPTPIRGVNLWIFDIYNAYRRFVAELKSGRRVCAPIFPRRASASRNTYRRSQGP